MELRVLRYFLAVAKEESITSAAQSLNVTQPTLSKQLMELEDELGKKLFLRGNRKITLTEDGLFLRKRAQEIIDLTDKTTSDFNNDCDDIRGNVYIGGGETDAMRFIAKTAKELKKEYPHIRYHLFSGNADDVTERLDKGLLDFGILIEPANMEKYDYIKLPVNDVWGLLMKKDCELAQKKTVCPDDLKEIPILTSRQTLVQNVISGWSGQDFQAFNIVATYNLVYNASLMVDEGVGYALCLDKLINTTGNSNLCFRPLEPRLEAHLNIVWKKYQVFSKATKMFLSKLQSEINNFVSE
ncbi:MULTISPECIES: LysR family transcriptional regulator [unclassified Clostridioides]|uniref:LysR family transcriptional regulator n=1 Tax=unclassified Clostridioides TaxID=2635829 RepID=UPI001D0C98D6|nr:LysR family transcriptional regulator [Clostridioides sp. ES-S-0001-02]MCC0640830.1 LysR family transcriptional regulator [Clostridioides sp. ES-S-0049-03]MCC0653372.1 LysR family transcriptional regulator [Clostridioides sp. ES-S-0001-03]MCC0656619.1 LysR family transcriptional regulator [Clostridioides sp. ES-S-0123-01]MCC0676000.1 LysR family transcriptional regulator [Clostridioides sp. ES-W-0018-02]MCC0681331.1 LysR family transcriptional regulator [Clostridioides sp. ES-S-0005-03]MCC